MYMVMCKKSLLTNNYQYYECNIDNHIKLDFTKGKNYNEDVVGKWYHTYSFVSRLLMEDTLKILW
jgi:hypothetical protein